MNITRIFTDLYNVFTNTCSRTCRKIDGCYLILILGTLICWSVFAAVLVEKNKINNQEANFYKKNYEGICIVIDSEIELNNVCDINIGCVDIYNLYCTLQGNEPNIVHAIETFLMYENRNLTVVEREQENRCAYYVSTYKCYVNKNTAKMRLEVPTYDTDDGSFAIAVILFGIFGGSFSLACLLASLCMFADWSSKSGQYAYDNV